MFSPFLEENFKIGENGASQLMHWHTSIFIARLSTGQTSSRMKSCSKELGCLGYQRPSKKDAGVGSPLYPLPTTPTYCPGHALAWTPQGNRNRGRPKETWRRTLLKALKIRGLTVETAPRVVADRARWRFPVQSRLKPGLSE